MVQLIYLAPSPSLGGPIRLTYTKSVKLRFSASYKVLDSPCLLPLSLQ